MKHSYPVLIQLKVLIMVELPCPHNQLKAATMQQKRHTLYVRVFSPFPSFLFLFSPKYTIQMGEAVGSMMIQRVLHLIMKVYTPSNLSAGSPNNETTTKLFLEEALLRVGFELLSTELSLRNHHQKFKHSMINPTP